MCSQTASQTAKEGDRVVAEPFLWGKSFGKTVKKGNLPDAIIPKTDWSDARAMGE